MVVELDSLECLMEKFPLADLGQLLTLCVLLMSSKTSPEDDLRTTETLHGIIYKTMRWVYIEGFLLMRKCCEHQVVENL